MKTTVPALTGGLGLIFILPLVLVSPPDTTPGRSDIHLDPGEIDLRFQQARLPLFSRATREHADVDELLRFWRKAPCS